MKDELLEQNKSMDSADSDELSDELMDEYPDDPQVDLVEEKQNTVAHILDEELRRKDTMLRKMRKNTIILDSVEDFSLQKRASLMRRIQENE